MNTNKKISKASLGRVSLYLNYLNKVKDNVTSISATTIAKALNLGEVSVRKDLSSLCGEGRPKTGYNINDLIDSLNSYLEKDDGGCIIVGTGKLGNALLNFKGFDEYGINIVAAFDHHPETAVYDNNVKKVLPTNELENFLKNNNIKIAIICVPESAAQETFDRLYKDGIRLFACFASSHLNVPEDAKVQYENLALSLAHLKTLA